MNQVSLILEKDIIKCVLKILEKDDKIYFDIIQKDGTSLYVRAKRRCGERIFLKCPISINQACVDKRDINFALRNQDLINSLELMEQIEGNSEKINIQYNGGEFIKVKLQGELIECLVYLVMFESLEVMPIDQTRPCFSGSSKYFRKVFLSCSSLRNDELLIKVIKGSVILTRKRNDLGTIKTKVNLENPMFNCEGGLRAIVVESTLVMIQHFLREYDEFSFEAASPGVCCDFKKTIPLGEVSLKVFI